jgi:hypothetical protein
MQRRHLWLLLVVALGACASHRASATPSRAHQHVTEASVRAHLEFLASDAMNGRGSGTRDEQLAAEYVAADFRAVGLEPPDAGGYVHPIMLERRSVSGTPTVVIVKSAPNVGPLRWTYGKEFVAFVFNASPVSGALQRIRSASDRVQPGAIAFVDNATNDQLVEQLLEQRPAAVFMRSNMPPQDWAAQAAAPPPVRAVMSGIPASAQGGPVIALVSTAAADALQAMADGTRVEIDPATGPAQTSYTYNVVGILRGADPTLEDEAILITAHLDHLGRKDSADGVDKIFNGADDDASGTVAVMEIAQALASRARPKRTVIFACFGSEETGGYGAAFFREKPPVPLDRMIANLEFEMIGRPDPKVPPHTLWMSGFDRSNLGAALASHGARLVADPHPEQNFFQRSDNYALARRGVVAHAVSSFGLHKEYHTPQDETRLVDYPHMRNAIESMIKPIEWLANSTFRPLWTAAGRPGL